MARRPTARSAASLREAGVALRTTGGARQRRARDPGHRPGDETVVIDLPKRTIRRINADGSMTIRPITAAGKDPKDAKFDDNLAEDADESVLQAIVARLLEGIESDIQSRREWEQTGEKGADMLGVKLEEATTEISDEGSISKIRNTAMLRACLSSWSNSRAELLPVGGPVKVRDDEQTEDEEELAGGNTIGIGHNGGPELDEALAGIAGIQAPAGVKRDKLAQAFENDFNHYLTVTDVDYYPDFSRMLMSRALLGCQFRKIYNDPILDRPVSRWVRGTDLIVSNDATSLFSANRITERIMMRQSIAKRLQVKGHWRDIALTLPQNNVSSFDKKIAQTEGRNPQNLLPADYLHTIYECYCELDEGDFGEDENGKEPGFPLPYRVTIDLDSRVILEIRRNWKKDDKKFLARRRYVKYGHVPGLGFYDWGFVHLIGNPQRGATMIDRCLIDTGMLNSFPGGVMAKSPGTRQRTTEIRPSPGQFTVMDTGGLPIDQFVMPWPYKEPSVVLQAKGQDLVNQMNLVAGIVELPVGEGRIGNTPVGTIMAYVETVTKVPSAVHKDDHISQQQEYDLLRELFAENPDALTKFARKPSRKKYAEQEIKDQDLVPAADPNVPSQVHRLMKVNMLKDLSGEQQFAGLFNNRRIAEVSVRTIGFTNTGEFINPPSPAAPPPPDPRIVAAETKAKSEAEKTAAKSKDTALHEQAETERTRLEAEAKAADRQSAEVREGMKVDIARTKEEGENLRHGISTAQDHVQHSNEMHQAATDLVQRHVQHLNEHDLAKETQQQQAAAAAAEPAAPGGIDTPPTGQ